MQIFRTLFPALMFLLLVFGLMRPYLQKLRAPSNTGAGPVPVGLRVASILLVLLICAFGLWTVPVARYGSDLPLLWLRSPLLELFGSGLLAAGVALVIAGQTSMGSAWSIAGQAASGQLVDHGLYARVRHPIYSGFLLIMLGIALGSPTTPTVLACASGFWLVPLLARLEERELVKHFGSAYSDYQQRSGRFLPPWR